MVVSRKEGGTTMERRYQMTRVGPGDYLLPSNDARTLWRIARYTEDGSAIYDDGTPLTGTYWGVWKYRLPMSGELNLVWDEAWEQWSQLLRTRDAAMREALALVPAPASPSSTDG